MARLRTDIGIYIIHFDKPLVGGLRIYGDEQHYVGKSGNIQERLAQHFRGSGSKNTKLAIDQGIIMLVGFTVNCPDTTELERYYTKRCRQYCEFCKPRGKIHFSEIRSKYKPNW